MNVTVRATDLDEVEREVKELLPHREASIHDGHIGGYHWLVVLVAEAESILRRRRTAASRRSGR